MKALLTLGMLAVFTLIYHHTYAQEKYGHSINIGLGLGGYAGYYGYTNQSLPVVHFDYEFDVLDHFTLGPFVNIASYSYDYYWGNANVPYRSYRYTETVVPIGVKAMYYADKLLQANSKWDFYVGGSLGFALVRSKWESGFDGNRNFYPNGRSVFLDLHLGTAYHIGTKYGMFFDLSTTVSTIGLTINTK